MFIPASPVVSVRASRRVMLSSVLLVSAAAFAASPASAQKTTAPLPPSVKSVKPAKPAVPLAQPALTVSTIPTMSDSRFTSVKGLEAFITKIEEKLEAEEKSGKDADEDKDVKGEKHDKDKDSKGPKVKKEGPDYLEAYLYNLKLRAYPNDTIDANAYAEAARARAQMPDALSATGRTKVGMLPKGGGRAPAGGAVTDAVTNAATSIRTRWEFVGPRNLPVPYNIYYGPSNSALSGRVNGIAYDPSNPSTCYLATAGGGIWKSLNGGRDWFAIGDGYDFLYTSTFAVDPSNGRTLYAGLGDFDGYNGSGYTGGVMKSTDGGATWTKLGQTATGSFVTLPNAPVSGLVVDPENSQIITICTGRAGVYTHIYRSTDGGANWRNVDGLGNNTNGNYGYWSSLHIGSKDANNKRFYYAYNYNATADALVGLYRSADRGATWKRVPQTLFTPDNTGNLAREAASPSNPDVVYVTDSTTQGIYKGVRNTTTDTDNVPSYTWTNITGSYPNDDYNWSQATYYDLHITVAGGTFGGATPKDIVYGGGITVAGSQDAAGTWTDFGRTYGGSGFVNDNKVRSHNDQHTMAINPLDPTLGLIGNDGGVYGLTYDPTKTDTAAWTIDPTYSLTLGLTQFYHADWHPTDASKMIGGAQDNASPTANGFNNTTGLINWINVGGGDGGGVAISPFNPQYQYTTSQNGGVYATRNGWGSSRGINPNLSGQNKPFVGIVAADPAALNLYFASNYLNRYTETVGWTYQLGGQPLASGSNNVSSVGIAPNDSARIYTGSEDAQLWMTQNGGTAWTLLSNGSSTIPNRAITSVSVNPTNKNDILVGLSGTGTAHLYRGTITGTTGSFVSVNGSGAASLPNFPLNEVTRDPNNPGSVWYAATDGGVFVTLDGGANWANATAPLGLPNVQSNAIKAVAGTGYVNVATYGRGMWRIPLLSAQTNAPDPNLTTNYRIVESGSNYVVTVTLLNGGGVANNVKLNTATLKGGTTTQTPTETLPIQVGTIATNGNAQVTLTFPKAGLTPGSRAILSLGGVYSIGTWSSSLRVTLPQTSF